MKTALRINTDFTTEILDLETDSLTQLQEAVGGLVQAADLQDNLTLWCNEEGKLINGMLANVIGTHMWEKSFGMTDIIMGDIVFTGGTDDEGDNLALPTAWLVQLQELAGKLRKAYEAEAELSLLDVIFWSA
jgi:hypothetical protein